MCEAIGFNANLRRKNFINYFADAIMFIEEAQSTEIKDARKKQLVKSFIRASIINSALALESAANCCLSTLPLQESTFADLEKLSTLSKFDIFLQFVCHRKLIDRNHKLVTPIRNIISCRNEYVHSKITLEPIINGIPELKFWEPLFLPKNTEYWECTHAIKIVTVISDFLNFFFFDLCGYEYINLEHRGHVKAILTSEAVPKEKGSKLKGDIEYASLSEHTPWLTLNFAHKYDIEFAFLAFTTSGTDNKPKYPRRQWGDYSHCKTEKFIPPKQPIIYRGPKGEIIIENF